MVKRFRESVGENVPLAPLTTLGVGGPARFFVDADDEDALRDALAWANQAGVEVALLGGGSNVLVGDAGFGGLVVRVRVRGVKEVPPERDAGARVALEVGAGEELDALVASCTAGGHAGIECLSGIPGYVGATPIQNVGAYGQEIGGVVSQVRVMRRSDGLLETFDNAACRFSYRSSIFKEDLQGMYVVLSVTLALARGGAPTIRYPELAREIAERGADATSLTSVRDVVLAIRRSKSMVVDASDPNHRSAGSFFINPLVSDEDADRVADRAGAPAAMPRFAAAGGKVKLSAAWLIERAGFTKGTSDGRVGISTRHALAIVNLGGATASEIATFAKRI
ncbi:MAG TPA: UDP-N-acetylmuramate dehydrogenase, partial [Polyangiaceae bacterium]|nr:UDP-N-acetylmuramate dehydrogenase [Polyangiaceae bacterium]